MCDEMLSEGQEIRDHYYVQNISTNSKLIRKFVLEYLICELYVNINNTIRMRCGCWRKFKEEKNGTVPCTQVYSLRKVHLLFRL